jgi:uncharacterized protein YycO
MRVPVKEKFLMFVLPFVLLVAGCSGGPEPITDRAREQPIQDAVKEGQAPKWITQKGAAFKDQHAVFYGVGNAAGLVNPSLKRRAAEAAARRDLAQEFQVYIAALQKQYLAETTGGSLDRHSVEQHVEDVMKQVTEQTLTGSSIVEYWEHPARNEAYALARLDLNGFHDALHRYRSAAAQFARLDGQVTNFMQDNADEMHDRVRHEAQERGRPRPPVPPAPPPTTPKPDQPREQLPEPSPGRASPAKSKEEACPGGCPGRESRPDPSTFETGDIIWPRQPWIFIPYNSAPTGNYESDKAGWEREKQDFVIRIQQDSNATEHDRAVAAELQSLTFEEFRARFLKGTEEVDVTASGWLPWIGHVAMIYVKEGRPWIIESTFGGVRMEPYEDWLKHRGKSLIWHGRVKGMDAAARARLAEEAVKQLKKPYEFFNFNLLDDHGFYCSKFAWYLIRKSMGVAVDDDPEPRRKFWLSPKQLIHSRHVQLLANPTSYSSGAAPVKPQSTAPRPVREVVPLQAGGSCELAFSQCVSRCTGGELESCTEACCCQLGGKQCPNAPDCCPSKQ